MWSSAASCPQLGGAFEFLCGGGFLHLFSQDLRAACGFLKEEFRVLAI